MPIYDFSNHDFTRIGPDGPYASGDNHTAHAIGPIQSHAMQNSDHEGGRNPPHVEDHHHDYVEEFLMPGFRYLDEAMKNYWSGLRVPTKDSHRLMAVRIAGGDKGTLIWKNQLMDGRTKLPVASISRISYEFNPNKFSPPYLPMARRYKSHDLVSLVYRPVPFVVTYEMTVWSKYKSDAEFILYQIATRFNPLATFEAYDEHISGCVTLISRGHTDSSDKEIAFNEDAKIKYDYKMLAEAWLPLPEKVVPTVLGHVNVVSEMTTPGSIGSPLITIRG